MALFPSPSNNCANKFAWRTPTPCFAICFHGSSQSTAARPWRTAPPIGLQWCLSGIPPKVLSSSLGLFHGATFANPIPDVDIVDIGIRVLNHTGLFSKEYTAWITCGDDANNSMNLAMFCSFWETAVNIAAFTATPASHMTMVWSPPRMMPPRRH